MSMFSNSAKSSCRLLFELYASPQTGWISFNDDIVSCCVGCETSTSISSCMGERVNTNVWDQNLQIRQCCVGQSRRTREQLAPFFYLDELTNPRWNKKRRSVVCTSLADPYHFPLLPMLCLQSFGWWLGGGWGDCTLCSSAIALSLDLQLSISFSYLVQSNRRN